MMWIAIAIILVGYLISDAIKQSKQKELVIKQKELEANPEYHKKVALEAIIEDCKLSIKVLEHFIKEDEQELIKAQEKKNRSGTEFWEESVKKGHRELGVIRAKFADSEKMLNGI